MELAQFLLHLICSRWTQKTWSSFRAPESNCAGVIPIGSSALEPKPVLIKINFKNTGRLGGWTGDGSWKYLVHVLI